MTQVKESEVKMTPEEIKDYLEKKEKFYDDQMPVLAKELAYQTTITQIEEQRLKQIMYVAQQGQILAPAPDDADQSPAPQFDKDGQPLKRKLKTD